MFCVLPEGTKLSAYWKDSVYIIVHMPTSGVVLGDGFPVSHQQWGRDVLC